MPIAGQKLAFVMASSSHGTMIVNRFDYRMVAPDRGYGVGFQILRGRVRSRRSQDRARTAGLATQAPW